MRLNNIWLWGCVWLAFAPTLWAEEQPRAMDRAHAGLERHIIGLMDRMDTFFGEQLAGEDTHQDKVKLKLGVVLSEHGELTTQFSGDIKLDVPRLRHKLQLIVDSEDVDVKEPADPSSDAKAVEDGQLFTGLRYFLLDTMALVTHLDGGIKIRHFRVTPFARLRFKNSKEWESWTRGLAQSFYWFEDDGFGEETRMDWTRRLFDSVFFRTTTKLIWSESSEGVVLDQGFALVHSSQNARRVTGLKTGVRSHVEPGAEVDAYRASVIFRQRIHSDWLYLQVEPRADFPRERDFDFTPSILLGFEVLFEEKNGAR